MTYLGLPIASTRAQAASSAPAATPGPQSLISDTVMDTHFTYDSSTWSPGNALPAPDLAKISSAKDLNAEYIRFDIWWNSIEPTRGGWDKGALAYYDLVISTITSNGMRPMAILGSGAGLPSWACSPRRCPSPSFTNDAKNMAAALAGRYSGNVYFYQLGNELNHYAANPQWLNLMASNYIKALHDGIAQGQSSFQTIVNAFADGGSFDTDFVTYFNSLLGTGGVGNDINVIGIDHYPGTWRLLESYNHWDELSALVSIANTYGKAAAVTETGYSTCGDGLLPPLACAGHTSAEQQKFIDQALPAILSIAEKNLVRFVGWYEVRDSGTFGLLGCTANALLPQECSFGILNYDGTQKVGYADLKSQMLSFLDSEATFQEQGLPFGTSWTVQFNGELYSSAGNIVNIPGLKPGIYPWNVLLVSVGGCLLAPNPGSGNYNTATQAPVAITFSGSCTVTFVQSGLPSGTSWSVTLDSAKTLTSTGGSISFTGLSQFAHTWSASFPSCGSGCRYAPVPSSDVVNPEYTSIVAIAYSKQYELIMALTQTNCGTTTPPAGASWRSPGSLVPISVRTANGCTFTGWTGAGSGSYTGSIPNGVNVVMNGLIMETAGFTTVVTFTETGLPPGFPWVVFFDSAGHMSTSSSLAIAGVSGGTHTYILPLMSCGSGCQRSSSPFYGSLTVDGPSTTSVVFTLQYQVTFFVNPSGAGTTYPSGTAWLSSGQFIFATPSSGYKFQVWIATGGVTVNCPICAGTPVTVTGTGTLIVFFTAPTAFHESGLVAGTSSETSSMTTSGGNPVVFSPIPWVLSRPASNAASSPLGNVLRQSLCRDAKRS